MKPQKRIGYLLTIAAIFVLSCDVSILAAPQQIPTSIPGSIDTIVAQTAAVAATRTAALIPPTLTPSLTPFPTKTASITPTSTATFIFQFPTSPNTPTPGPANGLCKWVSQTPANSTHFAPGRVSQTPGNFTHLAPGTNFTAQWTVTNTGGVVWMHTTVDIVYSSGSKLSPLIRYDTKSDTSVGSNYVISVPMIAPASAGTYSMTWSLQAGATIFCPVSLSIIVP